jgi:class 3 adenylate cyclase
LILLESIVRTNILWVTFLILHSLLETNYQFSQFFNDKTHIFLVLVTNLIGVMMGVANRNAEIFLVLLNHTNKQLHRYSEWFLGKDVLEMAITDPASLSLSRRERAVLFMDIRGFTRWSESQSPEKVVEMLNNYGETAEQCWLNSDAIKVKFTGDEIMIVFQSTAHALKVAQCMRHSIRALLESYGLGAGIGIHHGALVEGLVGSHKVKAYDIIGDTVNTAKRICDAAARGELLISQQAYDTLAIQSHTEELRALMVKGKSEAVVVHVV